MGDKALVLGCYVPSGLMLYPYLLGMIYVIQVWYGSISLHVSHQYVCSVSMH